MSEINGIIYKAENKINGKVYIGQTIKTLHDRKIAHKSASLSGRENYVFSKAIRKYGFDNFKWIILCETDSKEKLNALEKFYIACYRKMKNCYNSTNGGEGTIGYKLSQETKNKISASHKGKKVSEQVRLKMLGRTPWNKGKTGIYSEETIVKLKIARSKRESGMKGKPFPEASKIIISQKQKERGHWSGCHNPNYDGVLTCGNKNGMFGRKHTEESKKKMSEKLKGRVPWNKVEPAPVASDENNNQEGGNNNNG